MKLGPKNLVFTWPVWAPFRRHLMFIGRDNTLYLQETALVIEGDLIRFWLPILDLFVKRALVERSMVTIPYSRIVRVVYARYVMAKVLWWLLAAALFAAYTPTLWDPRDPGWSTYTLVLVALLLLLLGYVVHRFLRPRHALWFRATDGKRRLVCFCLRSRTQRRRFAELLRANRDAARAATA
jgi:hypothetical protein